jgi:transcriptional regulator with XRE-family HTH domain
MINNPEIKIKQIRELKNVTQEYIANQLGFSIRAYSKIESGETQLTINRLNEISYALGVDPIEVLGFEIQMGFNEYKHTENCNTCGNMHFTFPEKLMQQYEKTIAVLEDEVMLLKGMLGK